ncbi:hypothetical protein [Enterobacter asburiae]|uniref:hypothetical protein n=1 Tax=Enterobacter asburiae TaxID=61645 RepID=UPI001F4E488E|nr:hypothetical protein [Enterobacter asburiae]UNG07690.1 hypothetical protein MND42_23670 [Enterobacter asburiae]UOY64192.1 hypothetical protein LCD44_26035 [Enterobacter asburiae]
MSIISRRFDKKETGTVFRHAQSGKILYRLNARLELYDWKMLQAMISLVYKGSSQKTESMVTPVFATPILTTSWLA